MGRSGAGAGAPVNSVVKAIEAGGDKAARAFADSCSDLPAHIRNIVLERAGHNPRDVADGYDSSGNCDMQYHN